VVLTISAEGATFIIQYVKPFIFYILYIAETLQSHCVPTYVPYSCALPI
jgi:hypothetical protein